MQDKKRMEESHGHGPTEYQLIYDFARLTLLTNKTGTFTAPCTEDGDPLTYDFCAPGSPCSDATNTCQKRCGEDFYFVNALTEPVKQNGDYVLPPRYQTTIAVTMSDDAYCRKLGQEFIYPCAPDCAFAVAMSTEWHARACGST